VEEWVREFEEFDKETEEPAGKYIAVAHSFEVEM
jgi:hypothetical protein